MALALRWVVLLSLIFTARAFRICSSRRRDYPSRRKALATVGSLLLPWSVLPGQPAMADTTPPSRETTRYGRMMSQLSNVPVFILTDQSGDSPYFTSTSKGEKDANGKTLPLGYKNLYRPGTPVQRLDSYSRPDDGHGLVFRFRT